MIYTTKVKIAKALNKSRPKIDKMIQEGEIKTLFNDTGKKVGFVVVLDFIAYLVNKN